MKPLRPQLRRIFEGAVLGCFDGFMGAFFWVRRGFSGFLYICCLRTCSRLLVSPALIALTPAFAGCYILGSGVPCLNTFLLDLFLKGTTIKKKSILFSLWLLQSPEVVHGGFASAQGGRGALKPCLYWHPHSWNRVPGYIDL